MQRCVTVTFNAGPVSAGLDSALWVSLVDAWNKPGLGVLLLARVSREQGGSDVRDGLDLSYGSRWCCWIPSRRNASSPLYGPTRHCRGALLSGTRSSYPSLSSSSAWVRRRTVAPALAGMLLSGRESATRVPSTRPVIMAETTVCV